MDEFAMRPAHVSPPPQRDGDDAGTVDAVATWFARIGAVAILLAAAFGYSYAVERGLVTEPVRVALGALAGAALLLASEGARRRDWPSLAQAVAGAGLGLWYLSTWAAYERYDLIPGGAAFAVLAMIAVSGVGLAWRHDSEALAALATTGAFLVPYLVSNALDPSPILGYVALVDVGILATVTARPWRAISRLALGGTWLFAFVSADAAGPAPALVYGAAFWALFAAQPVLRAALGRRTLEEEPTFAVANAFTFWAFAMGLTAGGLEPWRGAITAALGVACLALSVPSRAAGSTTLFTTQLALGGGFLALAVPIEFEGPAIAAGWTVQAVVLVAAGRAARSRTIRLFGVGLLTVALVHSLVVTFQLGAAYSPASPVVSGASLTLLLQVAALHAVAGSLRRTDETDAFEDGLEDAASVGGHALALLWVAMEAGSHWMRVAPEPAGAIQFTITVAWSLYAAAVLAAGVLMRRRRTRLVALGTFGATIGKVVLVDLWLLTPPQRVVAFGALGVALLASSLLYHRFRALIVER